MKSEFKKYHDCAKQSLSDAQSLPFTAYIDSEVYNLESSKIFHNDWVFVCAEHELSESGDYFAFSLANEPIVVIRGDDKELRGLSNVCRHRGTILNDEGFGNTKRFVCPYHAWTYTDQGKLMGVPHVGSIDIDKSKHYLPEFTLEVWQGLVFVSLKTDISSIAERYAGILPYLKTYQIERFKKPVTGEIEHWNANWKLAMENGMESYHLFKVHKETLETITPTKQSFYVEGSSNWTITGGKIAGSSNKLWDLFSSNESKIYENYLLISLPPSFIGILDYDSFTWISILPKNKTECWVRSGGISLTDKSSDSSEKEFVNAFFAEDKAICERVQKGMLAKHSRGGKLVELERVVVDFHQYLSTKLFDEKPSKPFISDEAQLFISKD